MRSFRNNTNREIGKKVKSFSAAIKALIEDKKMQAKPEAPTTMPPKFFAVAYGFNDFHYADKFEKMIETVTSTNESVINE